MNPKFHAQFNERADGARRGLDRWVDLWIKSWVILALDVFHRGSASHDL